MKLLDSRPIAITEEDYDDGMDLQGLCWKYKNVPDKSDFQKKRYRYLLLSNSSIKDYGSLLMKPPPQRVSTNPVCHS